MNDIHEIFSISKIGTGLFSEVIMLKLFFASVGFGCALIWCGAGAFTMPLVILFFWVCVVVWRLY